MFPYGLGAWSAGSPLGMANGALPIVLTGRRELPEEVRAALEERQDEIHSAADMERLINELMLRR